MFDEAETRIFQHTLGRGPDGVLVRVWADPLEIWAALVRALEGKVQDALDAIKPVIEKDGEGKDLPEHPGRVVLRVEAEERLLAAIRQAFAMLDFDRATGTGATRQDCWDAFNDYLRWSEGEKSGDGGMQTGAPPTAGQPAVPSATSGTSGST